MQRFRLDSTAPGRLLRRSSLVLALLLCLGAGTAQAQLELTPFAGYRIGGELEDIGDLGGFDGVDFEDSESYGLILGIDLPANFQLEFLYSTQDSELRSSTLFSNLPGLDLDVEYLHVGVLYQFGSDGDVRPFVAASGGVTRLVPDLAGLDSEERASVSFGGGVKLMVSDHIGFRFEGRGFTTFVDDNDDIYCEDRRCYSYDEDVLWQVEARAGLIFRF